MTSFMKLEITILMTFHICLSEFWNERKKWWIKNKNANENFSHRLNKDNDKWFFTKKAAISKDSRFNCRQKYFYNLIFQKQKPLKKSSIIKMIETYFFCFTDCLHRKVFLSTERVNHATSKWNRKKYFKIHSIYVLRTKHHNSPKNHEPKNYYIVENFWILLLSISITPFFKSEIDRCLTCFNNQRNYLFLK